MDTDEKFAGDAGLFKITFQALGGLNEIQCQCGDAKDNEALARDIILEVQRIEQKYSRYIPESLLSRINSSAGKTSIKVDSEAGALLDYAQTCYKQSDGLFDITSGVLRRAWDFSKNRVPSREEVNTLLPLIGWDKVEWKKPWFLLPLTGMEIDFGGFGKEYAVDRAAQIAQERGFVNVLINFGGDVRVLGPQENGMPWGVGIVHPRRKGEVINRVPLSLGGFATSGDYERYIEVEGERYSHVLNPITGCPVESFQSVSVLAETCLVAGTASTMAMLYGKKKGRAFLEELGLPYWVVEENSTDMS